MTQAEGQPVRADDVTTNGQVVRLPLPLAPRGGGGTKNVDDALDAVVATVDHLVRDLETDPVTSPTGALREPGLPTREWLALASLLLAPARSTNKRVVHRALLVGALVFVVAIAFVLIGYVVSRL
jgi:hypothetical protein